MKKFIVDTGKKKYSVEANDAEHAVELVKKITTDEASQLQTVNALIISEQDAVAAYDVAIENLRGKIPEDSLQVLITTRDDENRHIENLQAVVNGTVTEKNLEDSILSDTNLAVGKTYNSKSGHKLTVKKINASYSDTDGSPEVSIDYDFEKTDGKKGSSKCSTRDFFKMLQDSMINDEEFIISKNGVPLDSWHPNDLGTSRGSLRNIIKFSNNSYMTFSNEGEAKDMLSAIKRDILDLSKSYPSTKENLLSLLNNLKVTKIKDAMINDGITECYESLGKAKDAISTIYKNYAKEQDSEYMLGKLNEASSAIARAIRQYKAWM